MTSQVSICKGSVSAKVPSKSKTIPSILIIYNYVAKVKELYTHRIKKVSKSQKVTLFLYLKGEFIKKVLWKM